MEQLGAVGALSSRVVLARRDTRAFLLDFKHRSGQRQRSIWSCKPQRSEAINCRFLNVSKRNTDTEICCKTIRATRGLRGFTRRGESRRARAPSGSRQVTALAGTASRAVGAPGPQDPVWRPPGGGGHCHKLVTEARASAVPRLWGAGPFLSLKRAGSGIRCPRSGSPPLVWQGCDSSGTHRSHREHQREFLAAGGEV